MSSRNQRIKFYFRRYWRAFSVGAFFLLLTNFATFAIPARFGAAVQTLRDAAVANAFTSAQVEAIQGHAYWIIGLALAGGLSRLFSRIAIFDAGRNIEFDVRNELYQKLTELGPSWFQSMPTGDLTSRITNDVNFIRTLFAITFLHIINTSVAYVIALRQMVDLSWEMSLWALVPYPLLLLVVRQIIRALFVHTKQVQIHLSKISSRVQENLSGVTVVKSYGMEGRESAAYRLLNESFLGKNLKLVAVRGALNANMTLIAGIGTLVVLMVGSAKVTSGALTLGEFVEFNGYVAALTFPTIAMGWVFSVWNRGNAAFDRVIEVLDAEPKVTSTSSKTLPKMDGTPRGLIEFKNVSFQYEGADSPALSDVSFTIPAGSTVAFVGRTGSGKSTILNLLARLHDPTEGEVAVDGLALKDVHLRNVRSEFGFVTQNPYLFSMTIGQNIRFGLDSLEFDGDLERSAPTRSLREPGIDVEQSVRVEESLEVAGLKADIDVFPRGLETLVGERGITLSGGQKQRVTIARALMMDPRILVLDDALSSVDTKTEFEILNHLDSIMEGRTTIICTHRFNALHRVDRIFVVDEGRIAESGTHAELTEMAGIYAELFEHQKLEEELN